MNDNNVRFFIPTADVVGLPHPASLQHAADGGAVVAHIEPVADLLAVAVIRFLSVSSCQIKNIPWNPRLLYLVKKCGLLQDRIGMARGKKEIFKPRIFTKLHEWGSAYALRGYGVMKWLRTDWLRTDG